VKCFFILPTNLGDIQKFVAAFTTTIIAHKKVGSRDLPSPKTTQNTSFFIWSQSIKAVTGPAGVEILVPAPVHHVGHAYKHHIITVAHLRGNHGNTHVRKSHRTRPFPHGLKQTCFSPIGLKPSVKPVVWLHTRKAIR